MDPINFRYAHARAQTRRQFLQRAGLSIGGVALGGLLSRDVLGAAATSPMSVKPPSLPGRADSGTAAMPTALDAALWLRSYLQQRSVRRKPQGNST